MHQQPGDRSCSNEAIGGNHDGPTIFYLWVIISSKLADHSSPHPDLSAKVSSAASAVGSQVGWFKIAEVGLVRKGNVFSCKHNKFNIHIFSKRLLGH